MHRFSLRATQLFRSNRSHRNGSDLATLDTGRRTPSAEVGRTTLRSLPLLSCALLGIGTIAYAAEPVTTKTEPMLKPITLAEAFKNRAKKQDAAAATPAAQAPAAAAPAGPKPGEISISGLVDFYYGVNSRAPHGPNYLVTPEGSNLRVDNALNAGGGTLGPSTYAATRDRNISFALAEININRAEGKGIPFGITSTLTFGDAAKQFHATEPGGTSNYYLLQNLFISKSFKVLGKDINVDLGKFASPFGMEVLESSGNDNYSRAYSFWYGVPFYHLGVRATTSLTPTLTSQFGLVNGWNDVADSNNAKSFYSQFTWKPDAKFTGILGYIGGLEGTGAFGSAIPTNGSGAVTINLLDFQSIYQLSAKTKLAGWVTYGDASGSYSPFGGGANTTVSGNWLGMNIYARHQLTPHLAFAARIEQFEDMPRADSTWGSPRLAYAAFTGTDNYVKLRALTLTAEYTLLQDKLITRLEYRHDHANRSIFAAGSGSAYDQDTLYASAVYKF